MAYNILAIRSPEEPADPLYPVVLNKGDSVQLLVADGRDRQRYAATSLSIKEDKGDGTLETLGTFGNAHHTVILTDARLIILSPNFKRPDTGAALWGENTLYLASYLSAKFQTHGRALVGHVPLVCIRRISVKGTGSKRHGNYVRLSLFERTGDKRRTVILQLTLTPGTDPRDLAQMLVRRAATAWLDTGRLPTQQLIDTAHRAQQAPQLPSTDDGWVSHQLMNSSTLRAELFRQLSLA